MNWKYHDPKFEYEEKLQDAGLPWAGHKLFAYDLIRNLKPKKIVELGTHYGTSLWSFCQAIKDENADCEINAVDTWEGDKHTGSYGEEVFRTVNEIKNKYYAELKINLIRKTFDEAIFDFENNSIDILHIDGLHTYEAVKHDFRSWLPKVKGDGVVLFHDIKVGELDFGVYKLWEELKKEYSTIEFHHSFGLGVSFMNKNSEEEIAKQQDKLQMHYYYINETRKNEKINTPTESVQQKDQEITALNNSVQQKDQEIANLNQSVQQKDQEIEFMQSSKFWKMREKYLAIKRWFLERK